MAKGMEVKEDEQEAPLRESWENIDFAETFSKLQNVVVDLQRQRQQTITYDMGFQVL